MFYFCIEFSKCKTFSPWHPRCFTSISVQPSTLFLLLPHSCWIIGKTVTTTTPLSDNTFLGNLHRVYDDTLEVHTSANWTFPVSTRSLASEQTGIECFTTGWRSKKSDVEKGATTSRSYFRAAMTIPTCENHQINVSNKVLKSPPSWRRYQFQSWNNYGENLKMLDISKKKTQEFTNFHPQPFTSHILHAWELSTHWNHAEKKKTYFLREQIHIHANKNKSDIS